MTRCVLWTSHYLRSDRPIPFFVKASSPQMGQREAAVRVGQLIGLNIDTTICKSRATVPSIFLHQDKTHNDAHTASETRTISTHMMNETVNEAAAKNPPFSSTKALRRKKRLSLGGGISVNNNNSLAPPERSPPLSPPPESSQPSSFPVALTPPCSPSDTCPASEKISPGITLSTPTSTAPILIEPLRLIPPTARTPLQTLPRIGTPQRPYYSTVRANMRNKANSTAPSTPSSAPSSPVDVDSQFPHLDGLSVSVLGGEKIYQPIPAVPSVLSSRNLPPIPVQMYLQSSSHSRCILSALDPACDDDDDDGEEDEEYIRFRTSSALFNRVLRKRKSSDLGEKQSRGNSHFPWSLPLSLGRKHPRPLGASDSKSEKEVHLAPVMPALFPSRSFGSFGNMSGGSMSGEIEMRIALAERNLNSNGDQPSPAFRFRPSPRPSYDEEQQLSREKGNGNTLRRFRSSFGLSSGTSLASSPPSPSKPNIGSKLKEMKASFFGKFSGDANRS